VSRDGILGQGRRAVTLPPARAWNNRPGVLAALALFWGAEMLLGLFLGAVLVIEGRGMPGWMLALAVVLASLLALIGLRLLLLCLRQRRLPNPVVAMDAVGLLDRRLAPAPIAWAEIAHVGVLHVRGTQVVFELTEAGRARIRQPERTLAQLNRRMMLPAYTLMPLGTDARPADLAHSLRAWFNATHPGAGADQP
jgi:hypothetical protein